MKMEQDTRITDGQKFETALKYWLACLADDELTLGHRDSEWLGLCPDIEGDVAFSSIAQDEVGHAVFYFDLLHQLGEGDPDRLAFSRDQHLRRNAILLERPNGDWAYSILRHYFYDLFDDLRLQSMESSSYAPLRQGTQKIRREEYYHLLHMKTLFSRLGSAGGQARERMEEALLKVWPDLGDLFDFGPYEKELLEFGIISLSGSEVRRRWEEQVRDALLSIGFEWPGEIPSSSRSGRRGEHSSDLPPLLDTLCEVYAIDSNARW
ncbi:1,2-phenylacetyl-CoA epoxidase subunit PaaC [Thermoactinomyces sp. CICC 10521]|uniref:1,2-phenylacetyl-CoA epoxidase subunit PaaC n=1 Tax=Thermoactinomyces sp. CICC 10521 TaxID=2767426 RepID=UPI0018DD9E50|nr:1,2-phenylacetyl-CoA epoxidase subunit PaaC [Thermoactinomyces sp. CICC 10521]MBH8606380.1 phenylacetate-CoA oxygenase subunit PaaC [Thermoactinomyces sp. CICC 10521]